MLDFTESEPEPGEYLDHYRYHMAFDDDERPEDRPVFDQRKLPNPPFSTPLPALSDEEYAGGYAIDGVHDPDGYEGDGEEAE